MRYVLTERVTAQHDQYVPRNNDPLAGITPKVSGMYDMRDGRNGDVIVASSSNLRHMRNYQARLNTADTLDCPVFFS